MIQANGLYSLSEAANFLNWPMAEVLFATNDGRIRTIKKGGLTFIRGRDLKAFVNSEITEAT